MGIGSRTYSILLSPDEVRGYSVTVPALPGCITQGDTVEECLTNAREAISVYVEELAASGDPVPEEITPPQLLRVTVEL